MDQEQAAAAQKLQKIFNRINDIPQKPSVRRTSLYVKRENWPTEYMSTKPQPVMIRPLGVLNHAIIACPLNRDPPHVRVIPIKGNRQ